MQNRPFEVFFDGDCPLCRREIDMIRRKDKSRRLLLTDIAAEEFQPSEVPLERLMKEIHGRFSDGTYVVGVDVFREIYERLGFGRVVGLTRWPVVRTLLGFAYSLFSRIRFRHAMHRMRKRKSRFDRNSTGCSESSCQQTSVQDF